MPRSERDRAGKACLTIGHSAPERGSFAGRSTDGVAPRRRPVGPRAPVPLGFSASPALAAATAPDTGSTAGVLTASALFLFMTLPGLARFYGGLVHAWNLLSVLMQCFPPARGVSPTRSRGSGLTEGKTVLGQLAVQALAVGVTDARSGLLTVGLVRRLSRGTALRVDVEAEHDGLDPARHGERAYEFRPVR